MAYNAPLGNPTAPFNLTFDHNALILLYNIFITRAVITTENREADVGN